MSEFGIFQQKSQKSRSIWIKESLIYPDKSNYCAEGCDVERLHPRHAILVGKNDSY